MIIKKLAVPLVNEKLLSQAVHCYISTGAVSEQGFDFVVNRLSLKCKVDIVTGLQVPTEPKVLRRIIKHFTDRVQLRIFTKNIFQPNVYIFDLPYRKAVAFIGSGQLTLGGLKDHEEIFYKISDPKEIEALKSWFTGYYEFSEPVTEKMIHEFEWVYPAMKRRHMTSREEARDILEITSRGFDWESIRFKNQYFQKEDYLVFGSDQAALNATGVLAERTKVQRKLLDLHESIKSHLSVLKLYEDEGSRMISSIYPEDHADKKVRSMWIAYGRSRQALDQYSPGALHEEFMRIVLIIRQKEVGIWLMPGKENAGREDRKSFLEHMNEPEYRSVFFQLLQNLFPVKEKMPPERNPYWIEVAGERRGVHTFPNEDALLEFTRYDDWQLYRFILGRNFSPGDPAISTEKISSTITTELDKLMKLYLHMREQP